MHIAAEVAIEWWKASGERSEARLKTLVHHYAATYALDKETAEQLAKDAWASVSYRAYEEANNLNQIY